MTVRAILLGLALGLFISGFTYFNDGIIRQSWFISHHLPIAVFGVLTALLLIVNPALNWIGTRWPLRASEVAIVAALGLAACGWPSFNFYWSLAPNTAMPNHWHRTATSWQAAGVMSYVPGGSAALAEGSVTDWPALTGRLAAGNSPEAAPVERVLWLRLTRGEQRDVLEASERGAAPASVRFTLVWALNRMLVDAALFPSDVLAATELPAAAERLVQRRQMGEALDAAEAQQLNRAVLTAQFPSLVLPPPPGEGVLFAGGEPVEAVDWIALGSPDEDWIPLTALPWHLWWPTLRLWGGLGLLLAGAALCLSLIVHPQWARREMLPYPLARFMHEISDRDDGAALPRIARSQLFWGGLLFVLILHSINGLSTWFPQLPSIPLSYNFYPLHPLFPNAWRIEGAWYVYRPHLYLAVIAFAFFLPAAVSFSVGFSYIAYLTFGALLLANGVVLASTTQAEVDAGSLMRFGAFVGAAALILYTGRRHYLNVARGMVGLGRQPETPRHLVVAAYGLLVSTLLAVAMLRSAGLDWVLSTLFILLVLLTFLVLTRIVCETGMFFVQAWWTPVGVLTALFGIEAIGPTAYIVLALASSLLIGDPRTLMMPYLATGLKIADRHPRCAPPRVASWLVVMLLVGFIVTGLVTFSLVHNHGAASTGAWFYETVPKIPFDRLTGHLADMSANETLSEAMGAPAGLQLSAIRLDGAVIGWVLLGLALLVVTAAARLRLAWWPIHPVLFLLWGTMPSARFAVSFLIGWAIKGCVVKTVGARGHTMLMPLMIGVIAGELLAALLWIVVGTSYFGFTGEVPPVYRIYP
ncbi:MAG: DUF6785 family protein [Phycisphaeraceae bacterium]